MKHEANAASLNSSGNASQGGELAEELTITEHEAEQVKRANASGATPVVFVHGLWLLPSSWDRWVTLFEDAGYVCVTPGWPDDPETVSQAREHPEVFAGKGIREIADYEEAIIRRLKRKPVIIGHSFGGLLTEILAGRGLAVASVAISPAPFRGVLPLQIAALRTASVALRNPANWNRAVPLTYEQFRYSFANVVGEDEAKELYLGYSVPGAGEPLFQAASANLNPWSEAQVDSTNPERGPMLIISADSDHTVPWAMADAAYKKEKRNPANWNRAVPLTYEQFRYSFAKRRAQLIWDLVALNSTPSLALHKEP